MALNFRKKRIVIAASSPLPASGGGGIQAYVHSLANCLAESYNYHVLCIAPESTNEGSEKKYEIYPFRIPSSVESEIDVAKDIFDRIVHFDPEIIINNDNSYVSSQLHQFDSMRKTLSIVHSPLPVIAKTSCLNHEYCDWVVAISEANRQLFIRNKWISSSNSTVIYNGLSEKCQGVRKIDTKSSLRVLFAGGTRPHKGFDLMTKLARRISDSKLNIKLYWAGVSTEARMFRKYANAEKVEALPLLPRAQLMHLLAKSDVLLMPSKQEGCPMLLLEAMSVGTVPLVSNCESAMKEILTNGLNGFILPVDKVNAWFNLLAGFSQNKSNLPKLSENAQRLQQNEYTIECSVTKLLNLPFNKNKRKSTIESFDDSSVIRWHRRSHKYRKLTLFGIAERVYKKIKGPDLIPIKPRSIKP